MFSLRGVVAGARPSLLVGRSRSEPSRERGGCRAAESPLSAGTPDPIIHFNQWGERSKVVVVPSIGIGKGRSLGQVPV